MNDADGVVLSVRDEARQLVAPDYAALDGLFEHTAGSKAEAVGSVTASLDRLTADLAALGGVPFDEATGGRPLTWSAYSATTREESYHDQDTGRLVWTGQVTATVALQVIVRDLDTLDDLSGVLAAHPGLNVHGVTWDVDWDNPAWPQVRAAAIGAAIGKARDYAAALGARCGKSSTSPTPACSAATPRRTGGAANRWASPAAPAPGGQRPPRSIPYRRNSPPPSRLVSVPPKYPCRALKAVPGG
jgi:uncharacterized protein YggE